MIVVCVMCQIGTIILQLITIGISIYTCIIFIYLGKKIYTNHVIKLYRILTPQCATFNLIEQNSLLKHTYIYLDMYN